MSKYTKYLPSKKFTLIAGSSVILAITIFVVFFMPSNKENYATENKNDILAVKANNQTLTELIQNDSDQDGIADWEEALWGTDKNKKITFNDTPDAVYTEGKKKELKIEESSNAEEQNLTETDKFARGFFTSYSAMKSSGQIDSDTINNFSNALGQKIVNPNLVNRYSETDVKINSDDTIISQQKYYQDVQKLFRGYLSSGLGDELAIISASVISNETDEFINNADQNTKLSKIASAYQGFAKEMMDVSVPASLARYHLQIANNANNTGISVSGMAKIVSDPIVGLSGLSQYQKYSEELISAVENLETILSKQ